MAASGTQIDKTTDPPALPRRLSPAAIAAWRQCPRRVWFSHVARSPRRSVTAPAGAMR